MLSQIGVGSSPEPYPYPYVTKLNLNYANVAANNANISTPSTNFNAWTPVQFFTNAAIRLLRSRAEFVNSGLCTNGTIYIPIYPTNFYTPSVHRMLQLAANIYDASTNHAYYTSLDFPSVFRPTFGKTVTGPNTIIYINGYTNVDAVLTSSDVFNQPADLRRPAVVASLPSGGPFLTNIYGIPYVIGVKYGLPSFNNFTMVPVVQVTRSIQLIKPTLTAQLSDPGWQTNISYQIGISNVFAASCWNSYLSTFSNSTVLVYATNEMTMTLWLTNDINLINPGVTNITITNISGYANTTNLFYSNTWAGRPASLFNPATPIAPSFRRILLSGTNFLNNVYVQRIPVNLNANGPGNGLYPPTPRNYIPGWSLIITNRLRVILQDQTTGRLLDYVQLGGVGQMNGMDSFEDINGDLQNFTFARNNSGSPFPFLPDPLGRYSVWTTNAVSTTNNTPRGIYNQLIISAYSNSVPNSVWMGKTPGQVSAEVYPFDVFIGKNATTYSAIAAYTPTTKYTNVFTWSANDPLVHYQATDLNDFTKYWVSNNLVRSLATNTLGTITTVSNDPSLLPGSLSTNVQRVSTSHYLPWTSSAATGPLSLSTTNLAFKDPLITQSDDWQFPTNKFPNIGWLGRVHRGTPWQTVYLKSSPVADANIINHTAVVTYPNGVSVTNTYANHASWEYWSGNSTCWPGGTNESDASISEPTNDWKILDLFTTAPNENASRGQLSVNQGGTAAWAAVLDGVIIVSNNVATNYHIIDPSDFLTISGTNTPTVNFIASAINLQRQSPNYSNGVFTSVGDILSVPQLTVASPYLDTTHPALLNDNVYERIPQQILSLLRVGTPRYVIYAYGQSLKPADRSIYQGSGPYFGMCTNYQITGEVVTRTVVRFEPANSAVVSYPPLSPVGAMRPVVESFTVLPPE